MKKMYYRVGFLGILLVGQMANAQTVNNGTMVVMPGTILSTVSDFDNTPTGDFVNDGEFYVYANFNNDGLVTYTPGPIMSDGYTRFQGTNVQKISGSMPSELMDVLFYNQSVQPAFELSGAISVAGNSEFNQGIVNNDDFGGTISFEQEGTHTSTWNGSHVDGEVIKNGSTDFQYPIGDKNLYRYARISAPTDVASTFTGKYFFENSNPLYPHSSKQPEIELINNQEYWTLTKEGGTSDILLTLSWDELATTPANVIASPESDIHIVRWDEALNMWVDEGGIADVNNKTVTTSVEVTGYGVFTLARVKTLDTPCVKIYNAVTPKTADGLNDYFFIECINNYPNNTVEVYNRWGVKVFDTKNYDSNGNVFNGYSNGRTTIDGSKTLPTGTYFYILTYEVTDVEQPYTKKQAGYLYLNAN
ncbi:gliding motility-associated-like protein [Flavobacterium arsenatis]|uniref:Gliding motility-associated-like protein n=1 Tax=Flavobacterium arsenatis TaxID=1484332 RepID=A0ABU1TMY8_9FLAO|nr:gliding motility-associated C-terminal domain-containing protein [Flavobacterium arsenatis]MDR6967334.1 gliding motility-associated-like protein [Flavobacterium arsenatis]